MTAPTTPTTTVQSADGTTIAIERIGNGPALVLVPGAFQDRSTTRGLAKVLSSDFAVFIYDRRGRGASGDTPPYAVEREIEDLDAAVGETGSSPFLFGHSSGAVLVLEAAARGMSVSKVVAYEPPYIVDASDRPDRLAERVGSLVASGQPGEAMKLFFTEGPQLPPEAIAAMQQSPWWSASEAIVNTLLYDLAIVGDQVVPSSRLANIRVPTLVLSGRESAAWARKSVEAVASAIPGAQHDSLEGQTHGVSDDAIAPVLRRFFLT